MNAKGKFIPNEQLAKLMKEAAIGKSILNLIDKKEVVTIIKHTEQEYIVMTGMMPTTEKGKTIGSALAYAETECEKKQE